MKIKYELTQHELDEVRYILGIVKRNHQRDLTQERQTICDTKELNNVLYIFDIETIKNYEKFVKDKK